MRLASMHRKDKALKLFKKSGSMTYVEWFQRALFEHNTGEMSLGEVKRAVPLAGMGLAFETWAGNPLSAVALLAEVCRTHDLYAAGKPARNENPSKSKGKTKQSCNFCKKPGHTEQQCYKKANKKQNSPDSSGTDTTGVRENKSQDQSYTLVHFDNVSVEARLDTCADVHVMSRKVAEDLIAQNPHIRRVIASRKVEGADGRQLRIKEALLGRITYEDLVFDNQMVYILEQSTSTKFLVGTQIVLCILQRVYDNARHFSDSLTSSPVARARKTAAPVVVDYLSTNPQQMKQQDSVFTAEEIRAIKKELGEQKREHCLPPAAVETLPGKSASTYRRMSHQQTKTATELAEEFLEQDFIEECTGTDWLNPIVLVRKPTGKHRMCLDLRRLNELVEQDNYPLPDIATITDSLRDSDIFSKLDTKDGFYRIPLKKEHRMKTTFKVGNRHYRFKVLPMGFKNAPNIFQRTMTNIFADQLGKDCIIYIDGILIHPRDKNEHYTKIVEILRKLKSFGLEINWQKAELGKEKLEFLGHEITKNKIRPTQSRVEAITNYPKPTALKQLRRFIGLLAYNRRFIEKIPHTEAVIRAHAERCQVGVDSKTQCCFRRSEAQAG